MVRRCGHCAVEKPLSSFHRWRDDYQTWCKTCKREYSAAYYQRNRAARAEYTRRQRAEYTRRYQELKRGRPCSDCGGLFHPVAMQWDHRPGTLKIADVADLRLASQRRLLAEIEKCDLVCANCHAVRT